MLFIILALKSPANHRRQDSAGRPRIFQLSLQQRIQLLLALEEARSAVA